jgi:hypothetical protein
MPDPGFNIIHLPYRIDRLEQLRNEILLQQIPHFKIWDGILGTGIPAKDILKAHQQIVHFAKEQNMEEIIIAEDDIQFTAKGAYQYYLTNQPSDFDLYLGGIIWGDIKDDKTVNDFSGTSLYTISQRFYDLFLSIQPGKDFDRQLAGKGKFVVCKPMVALQHSGYSDNSKREIDFSRYTAKYKLYNG